MATGTYMDLCLGIFQHSCYSVCTHAYPKEKKASNQQQIGNVGSNSTVNQANGSINIGRNEHFRNPVLSKKVMLQKMVI